MTLILNQSTFKTKYTFLILLLLIINFISIILFEIWHNLYSILAFILSIYKSFLKKFELILEYLKKYFFYFNIIYFYPISFTIIFLYK